LLAVRRTTVSGAVRDDRLEYLYAADRTENIRFWLICL
jgi:hypothetical protein